MAISMNALKWPGIVVCVLLLTQCAKKDSDAASSGHAAALQTTTPLAPAAALPAVPTPAAPVAPNVADKTARLEECRTKLKAAVPLDLITNMSFDNGRPKLWVGATWHKIDITAKEGLAREAACFFLAGDESQAITFPIYDGMTGKEIAQWKFTKLHVE